MSGTLPSPAELAAALAEAPQSTPAAPVTASPSPPRTPSPKPPHTAYPPVIGPTLDHSTPTRPSPSILPSRDRTISVSSAPDPFTQHTMTPTVLASRSWSDAEDEGPCPHPDFEFSLPIPTRDLPPWRTHNSEEMSHWAKEGHELVNAWIKEDKAKKRKAKASGRLRINLPDVVGVDICGGGGESWEPERTIPPSAAAKAAISVLADLDLYLLSPPGWTGVGLAVRLEEDLWAEKKETLGQYRGVYKAELFVIYLAISSIPQLFPSPSSTATLHILADNVSALIAPANPRPTPGQSTRLATLAALCHARRARLHMSI
ncbi:hypothetical protein JCM8097_003272 [Rhodosporidiobolus ruineniae]